MPNRKKNIKKLRKYSTAQLVEELNSRAGVEMFKCHKGLICRLPEYDHLKSYPKDTVALFVNPQEIHPE